ncbi:MAG: Ldh family oxidoreductase, partial [Elusimicrobiota bacterium]
MSAAFQQGAFLKTLLGIGEDGKPRPYALGHFFIAYNIESFTELPKFKKTVGDICRQLRASKKAPGAKRIYTPWEKEYDVSVERKDKGVPVDDVLQKQLVELRDRYNLKQYKFEFE